MYGVDGISRWQMHCSRSDFTQIIYTILKFYSAIHTTQSCVQGYAHAGRLAGSPELAVTLGEFQNDVKL